jgi:alcohol dehydrogenase
MIPDTMKAIVTTGNGGYDKLELREVKVPALEVGEVLVKVLAAGVNNTEINTRLGWYSSSVEQATNETSGSNFDVDARKDGGWNVATPFPFIQGTDCCGEVVTVGHDDSQHLLRARVLIRACMRTNGFESWDNRWMGSDFDGAFAEYVKVPATEVFPINSDWTDAELGSIPCAYGTAENMLERANVAKNEVVLVTGASGGVGSATVQLAARRGAQVIAVAGKDKLASVRALGADQVCARDEDLLATLGEQSVDVVVDNVAGEGVASMLKLLKRGGRLATSGAIAGPMVQMDLRDTYLKDISLLGSTAWDEVVFPNLIGYIERGEIKPLVAEVFPMHEIVQAQTLFLQKKHVGKFVLVPKF